MKKKKIWFSLLLGLFSLILVACSSSSTVTETTETATTEEVVSGATEREYTDPSEIKDSYDVIVVGSGGAGMAAGGRWRTSNRRWTTGTSPARTPNN